MTTTIRTMTVMLAVLMMASLAQAHTTLRSSVPASGSVVTESPETLTLAFSEPTRLTSLMLVTPGGERRLTFTPTGSSESFVVTKPELLPGRNEIRWRALSVDGHVVNGVIIIVLRAAD